MRSWILRLASGHWACARERAGRGDRGGGGFLSVGHGTGKGLISRFTEPALSDVGSFLKF